MVICEGRKSTSAGLPRHERADRAFPGVLGTLYLAKYNTVTPTFLPHHGT